MVLFWEQEISRPELMAKGPSRDLELLLRLLLKHYISPQSNPNFQEPHTQNPAKELTLILEGLNESGRAAVLHHARELSKIPDYQKKEH